MAGPPPVGRTTADSLEARRRPISVTAFVDWKAPMHNTRSDRLQPPERDTALAADLLHWARNDAGDWALILAEDDDFIPPVFTAESWIRPFGGRLFIVRKRLSGRFVQLDGLLERLNP